MQTSWASKVNEILHFKHNKQNKEDCQLKAEDIQIFNNVLNELNQKKNDHTQLTE